MEIIMKIISIITDTAVKFYINLSYIIRLIKTYIHLFGEIILNLYS